MPLYALDEVSPRLAAGVWIAPDAQVIGDVRLGIDTSVWFGAVLRGDNERLSLGPRSEYSGRCHFAHRSRLSA